MKKLFLSMLCVMMATLSALAIDTGEPLAEPTISPEPGAAPATGLQTFNLKFSANVNIDMSAAISFKNIVNNLSYETTLVDFQSMMKGMVLIKLTDFADAGTYLTEPGTYELSIPAGTFIGSDGAKNAALSYQWTIEGTVVTDLVPSEVQPTGIVETFDNFTLYFPENVTVKSGATLTVVCGKTSQIYGLTLNEENPRCVEAIFDEPLIAEGDYTVMIPAGVITGDSGATNADLTYSVTVGSAELKIVQITPDNSEPIEMFADLSDQLATDPDLASIMVIINHPNEVAMMEASLIDEDDTNLDAVLFTMKELTKREDGSFVWVNKAYDYKLVKDHVYTLTLVCYDSDDPNPSLRNVVGTLTYQYTGAYNVASASAITCTNINPTPGSMIDSSNDVITFTFTGPAVWKSGQGTYGGMGAGKCALSATAANEEQTEWNVLIPEDFLKNATSEITLNVFFEDEYQNYITTSSETQDLSRAYNMADETWGIKIRYDDREGAVTVDVDPAGPEVEKLYTFTFTNPYASSNNEITWGGVSPNVIELLDATGTRVAMGATYQQAADWSSVTVTLNKEITANGTYRLVVPYTALTLGSEYAADAYKGQTIEYVIANNNTEYTLIPVSVEPENGASVTELSVITLTFDQEVAINEVQNNLIIQDRTIGQWPGVLAVSEEDAKVVTFTLNEPITDNGQYLLFVTQNTIGNLVWQEANMMEGVANPQLDYNWIIENTTGINEMPVNAAAEYYTLQGVKVQQPVQGLYIRVANGRASKVFVK